MAEHVKRLSISAAGAPAGALSSSVPTQPADLSAAASPAAAASSSAASAATHRAVYAFQGSVDGQLSYEEGALLQLVSKEHEAWWRFKLCSTGQEGLVAATYVTEISPADQPSHAAAAAAPHTSSLDAIAEVASPQAGASGVSSPAASAAASAPATDAALPRHAALYDFPATVSGQLALTAGEALSVLEKGEHGWWTVRNERGEQGLVPANYLDATPLPSQEAAAVSAPATAVAATGAAESNGSAAAPLYESVMVYDYAGSASGASISVTRGQLLSVVDDSLPDWLSVRGATGASGLVPANFTVRVLGRAKALYAVEANAETGMLGLHPEQMVLVTHRNEDGHWATGWTTDEPPQTGLFPVAYVADV